MSHPARQQLSLALATSLIHRSRSLDELQKTFFTIAPKFVNGDAFGMYLFDDQLNTKTIFSHHANQEFLDEYESLRNRDPLFRRLLQHKKFTHSLGVFDAQEWLKQPLHHFLSEWGLDYSIEAPLIVDGQIRGTLNIARGGRRYFGQGSLNSARFLCSEVNIAFRRIHEMEALKSELTRIQMSSKILKNISGRARDVLDLAVFGFSNRAIASRLGISENTVRHHLKRIYRVFQVHNRAQLVQCVLSAQTAARPN